MAQVVSADPRARSTLDVPQKMTYEQFLAWADEDTRAEWIAGEVIESGPASSLHQSLSMFLSALLKAFIEEHRLGEVWAAPFQMKTGPHLPGREPDLLFVTDDRRDRVKEAFLDGPADLVVEIISADSRGRDRGDKFYEYEEGGVREYWLLDPERRQAEFYQLGDDGFYHLSRLGADGVYSSAVLPGLWIRVDWLWSDSQPSPLEVFRQWGLR